jgi:hypothetical protein
MQAWASRPSIESASGSLADLAAGRERHLAWDGCLNVRDLGGHTIEDGRATRFGSIVRADSVRQLSEAGWEQLVAYGVVTTVDLRGGHADIAADYALSEERLRPRLDAWLAEAESEAERERIHRISATPAEAMTGVLEELERRYGSVEAFLRAAGVTKSELVRIRERLVA